MMDTLIERFPAQVEEALAIGEKANIHAHDKPIYKVFVAGLGGSGIGANFASEFIKDECSIPYTIGKGYGIPAYIDENTLAIISSYSGNTEETLSALALIEKTGAKIVCISSGGKLIARATEMNYDYIQLPGDWPSPRACLGYSLIQQLFIMHKLDFIGSSSIEAVRSSVNLLTLDKESIHAEAKSIAAQLHNKIPIIYTTDRMEAVALRFRQQVNENSKMLCWHHIIPEMNHNELVGWTEKNENFAVVYFRNEDDLKRNQVRIEINKKIISKYTPNIIEIFSKGKNLVEKSIYFVHLGDWVSWYLSQLHGVDAQEINVIDYLKSELAKV